MIDFIIKNDGLENFKEYHKKHSQKAYLKKIQLIEQAIKERIVNSYSYSDSSSNHNNKKLKI